VIAEAVQRSRASLSGFVRRAARFGLAKNWQQQQRAWQRFHQAVKRGEIKRPSTCAECNREGRVEAHHHDYAEPLNVAWLCKRCHMREHVRMGAELAGDPVEALRRYGIHEENIQRFMRGTP
jgi:hypothetical protein